MGKVTMKEQVLQFVESKGSAKFTEIQKFIVDTKFGKGTYGSRLVMDSVWNKKTQTRESKQRMMNPYRGYYSAAFTLCNSMPVGYFLKGANRLVKMENGKYCVIRESK